jgi:hypothetical protein
MKCHAEAAPPVSATKDDFAPGKATVVEGSAVVEGKAVVAKRGYRRAPLSQCSLPVWLLAVQGASPR